MGVQRISHTSSASDPEVVKSVQEMFTESPKKKSIRQAAREIGLSFHCTQTLLKKQCVLRPHCCQTLSAEDCHIHMEFVKIMLARHEDWPDLFSDILCSVDAVFHVGWFASRHNCHYCADEDPCIKS